MKAAAFRALFKFDEIESVLHQIKILSTRLARQSLRQHFPAF